MIENDNQNSQQAASAAVRNAPNLAKIAQAELDGKTTFPFTSGQNKYDFIDLDELAT